jgi:hypothetical protein
MLTNEMVWRISQLKEIGKSTLAALHPEQQAGECQLMYDLIVYLDLAEDAAIELSGYARKKYEGILRKRKEWEDLAKPGESIACASSSVQSESATPD